MKHSIKLLSTIILFAALVVSGCDNTSDKMDRNDTSDFDANRNMEMETSEAQAEFRTYRVENSARIMQHDSLIEDIKEEIDNEPDEEIRESLQTRLDELQETNRELKREMDDYRVSGRDNWDEFKDNFDDKMDELGDSLDDFFTNS